MPEKSKGAASLWAGIAGGAIFLLFLFILKLNPIVAILISAAAYFGIYFVLAPEKEKDVELHMNGVTPEMLDKTLKEGAQRIKIMRSYIPKVKKTEIKAKLEAITVLIEKIYEDFQKDPKDIKAARQFLNYSFEATLQIINRYTELQKQAGVSEQVRSSLTKVEKLLDTIEEAFEKQLAKLLQDDIMDLDTEIQLMENTFRLDGINIEGAGKDRTLEG